MRKPCPLYCVYIRWPSEEMQQKPPGFGSPPSHGFRPSDSHGPSSLPTSAQLQQQALLDRVLTGFSQGCAAIMAAALATPASSLSGSAVLPSLGSPLSSVAASWRLPAAKLAPTSVEPSSEAGASPGSRLSAARAVLSFSPPPPPPQPTAGLTSPLGYMPPRKSLSHMAMRASTSSGHSEAHRGASAQDVGACARVLLEGGTRFPTFSAFLVQLANWNKAQVRAVGSAYLHIGKACGALHTLTWSLVLSCVQCGGLCNGQPPSFHVGFFFTATGM